ncbi:MAG: serine protease [Microcystis aeruginosa Ma_MB_F_20061100_S19]|uniref:V8-like Glu-specific endopeptidase n=1 Tax=Microcystis aeruginosa SPC777 TaxID=482300 RepID=S3JUM1_MICAE|nr:serine protease [Microcystis aeruginosa]EPF23572.1 V8-like Glu-specific endopeptidase [Microcystis aeruginosa SPC777]NCS00100.1 trypsin-like peptidase domain-containing protein [Microcystis aeruginosa L311-01]TRU08760.1 MAG: serine protease [Microcystis aeruginosa Ma_MB_F_20061100_S19]TRU12447.1 MAG: serine protease [Microcystis aeruginosa Ma_MB_F_20061100_S19D]
MKIRFILLFVLSLILFCFLPSLAQTSPATLEDITVRIDTNSNHPADVGGSGVLIRGSGDSYTILTAYHVIKDNNLDYIIKIPNKKSKSQFDSYVIDSKNYSKQIERIGSIDLAKIKIYTKQVYKTATLDPQKTLQQYDTLYVAGYPLSKRREYFSIAGQFSYISDYQSEYYGYLDEAYYFDNLNTSSGMSGGPVVDKHGYILGVFLGKSSDKKNSEAIASVALPIKKYPDWKTINKPTLITPNIPPRSEEKEPPFIIDESQIITTNDYREDLKYVETNFRKLLTKDFHKSLQDKPITFWANVRNIGGKTSGDGFPDGAYRMYGTLQNLSDYTLSFYGLSRKPITTLKKLFDNRIYLGLREVDDGYGIDKSSTYFSISKDYQERLLSFRLNDIVKIEAIPRQIDLINGLWTHHFFHVEIHRITKIGNAHDYLLDQRCKWLYLLPREIQNQLTSCQIWENLRRQQFGTQ